MWENFVQCTIKEEGRFWIVDLTIDEVMDSDNLNTHVMMITGDLSFDSDDLGCETLE